MNQLPHCLTTFTTNALENLGAAMRHLKITPSKIQLTLHADGLQIPTMTPTLVTQPSQKTCSPKKLEGRPHPLEISIPVPGNTIVTTRPRMQVTDKVQTDQINFETLINIILDERSFSTRDFVSNFLNICIDIWGNILVDRWTCEIWSSFVRAWEPAVNINFGAH
jgi:hypothetical protein